MFANCRAALKTFVGYFHYRVADFFLNGGGSEHVLCLSLMELWGGLGKVWELNCDNATGTFAMRLTGVTASCKPAPLVKTMPDNKLAPTSIEFLNERMNQLAREIGAMDPDDPRWIELIDEMAALRVISAKMASHR